MWWCQVGWQWAPEGRGKFLRLDQSKQSTGQKAAVVPSLKLAQVLPVQMTNWCITWPRMSQENACLRLRFLLNKNHLFILTIHLNYKSVHTQEQALSHFGKDRFSLRQQHEGGAEVVRPAHFFFLQPERKTTKHQQIKKNKQKSSSVGRLTQHVGDR